MPSRSSLWTSNLLCFLFSSLTSSFVISMFSIIYRIVYLCNKRNNALLTPWASLPLQWNYVMNRKKSSLINSQNSLMKSKLITLGLGLFELSQSQIALLISSSKNSTTRRRLTSSPILLKLNYLSKGLWMFLDSNRPLLIGLVDNWEESIQVTHLQTQQLHFNILFIYDLLPWLSWQTSGKILINPLSNSNNCILAHFIKFSFFMCDMSPRLS